MGEPGPAWKVLLLPTLSFVLGTAAQATFLFFLVPSYAQAYGLGNLQLVAFAASALATTALGVPAGRLADNVPRRRVFRLGWALMAAGSLGLALAPPGMLPLLVASALMGAGLAFGYTAFQSYVADVIRGAALANGYGATSALAMLGCAAVPFAGAAILAARGGGPEGITLVLHLLTAVGVAAVLTSFALPTMRTPESVTGAPALVGFSSAVLRAFDPRRSQGRAAGASEGRGLRAYAVAYALLGLGYGLSAPWLGPYLLAHHGMSAAAWGALLGWSTVLGAVSVYFSGPLSRRAPHTLLLAAGTNGIVALTLAGFAFVPLAVAGGLFLVRTFFGNTNGAVLSAGLMREVDEGSRGRAFGLTNLAWNLPWAIGAAMGGVLMETIGGWTFVAASVFLAAGPVVGYAMLRARPPRASDLTRSAAGAASQPSR